MPHGNGEGDGAAAADGGADFLRRLSVADAKILLERTKKEQETKTLEMQKMIGVRYRDLIESADVIVAMHSAAIHLEAALKEMPAKWKHMEVRLASALATSDKFAASAQEVAASAQGNDDGEGRAWMRLEDAEAPQDLVVFLVNAQNALWEFVDLGESLRAFELLERARRVFRSKRLQDTAADFPFLEATWACIQSFEQRIKTTARMCLTCRGKTSRFYADNLAALASLEHGLTAEDLTDIFLASRTKWLQVKEDASDEESDNERSARRRKHELRANLKSIVLTISQAHEIFGSSSSLFNPPQGLLPTEKLYRKVAEWFTAQRQRVRSQAEAIIRQIPSIAQISKLQSQLSAVDSRLDAYRLTPVWGVVKETCTPAAHTAFAALFGEALRSRTRDLVQHSFVDALESVKNAVRASIDAASDGSSAGGPMQCVRFFDFFDAIHQKVAGLASSELQGVLAEEYVRTLFRFVIFLEKEFPWEIAPTRIATASQSATHLSICNMLTAMLTDFPKRMAMLFGIEELSSSSSDESRRRDIFARFATEGRISTQNLKEALQMYRVTPMQRANFLDEELEGVVSLGYFSFNVFCQVDLGSTHFAVFSNVLRGISGEYCKSWALALLRQKIAPLRSMLQMEVYDQTNEEWIASHDGWSEHVIVDEVLSGDEGELSDGGGGMGEEKVWLPWCETPTVSSFLFSCCHALDDAYRTVREPREAGHGHGDKMAQLIRSVLIEQLTILVVDEYDQAVNLLVQAKDSQQRSLLNFGECCILQFLFDMYFVRATLGFSDFIRFGWGDEIDTTTCSRSLLRLKQLFERMREFIDPVDWEIYGPQLIENVVVQFRKSRLLFSSLSQSKDISEINGKPIVLSAQDTRPILKIAEPVPRFSLLPIPSSRRTRLLRADSASSTGSRPLSRRSSMIMDSTTPEASVPPSLSSLKLPSLLSSSTSSNLLSAATTGSNLLSSGMSFLSSATSSYLREGDSRTKYF